jgi:hypothetical protein
MLPYRWVSVTQFWQYHALLILAEPLVGPLLAQNIVLRLPHCRAVSRGGELLQAFQSVGERRSKTSGGTPTSFTQRDAAAAAGLSKDQEVQATRVGSVPAEEFERRSSGPIRRR